MNSHLLHSAIIALLTVVLVFLITAWGQYKTKKMLKRFKTEVQKINYQHRLLIRKQRKEDENGNSSRSSAG